MMDETLSAAIDGIRNANGGAFLHTGQSVQDINKLLQYISLELHTTRERAKQQSHMQEARERHLEDLLRSTRRERDEYRDKYVQLQSRLLSSSMTMSQEQLGALCGHQPLESVSSMSEPSRVTLTEVHRKILSKSQLDLQKQLEYVSCMNEPTRETLSEVHRKMQEQQQHQHLGIQQMDIHHIQHRLDLQQQHSAHSHELRRSPSSSHLDFQSQQHQQHQHQHHLEELRKHLELGKDSSPDQQQQHLQMDISMGERRQPGDVGREGDEVDDGSEDKSTAWNEFPTSVHHMDIHSSSDPCLILESPDRMHMKLPQGMPHSPRVDQHSHSPQHLDDIQQHLHQQQHHQHQQQDENMQQQQLHLHHHQQLQQHQQGDDMQMHIHQQEPEQLINHMQQQHQGQGADQRSLHIQEDHQQQQPLRRQLSKHSPDRLSTISASLQGTSDSHVMNVSVLQQQQHSTWPPVGMMGLTSSPLSNGISDQLLQGSCLQGGSVVASILSPLERLGDSSATSLLMPRPVHLPEPPEADPQVMLNSLPEKGKLLQAVMQAGPLLQTLLLAGPLPQWRHPPPHLDAEEIPRVSMGATTVGIMPPPVEQAIGIMASHGSGLEQVMRLNTPVQSSPSQNGFCH